MVRVSVTGSTVTVVAVAKGAVTVTVTASDPDGLTAQQNFDVTVPNQAPVAVGIIGSLDLTVGRSVELNVESYFDDPDGDALAYTASVSDSAVAGIRIGGSVVTIRGLSEGRATITVTATDGDDLSAAQEAPLTVWLADRVAISPDRPPGFGDRRGGAVHGRRARHQRGGC